MFSLRPQALLAHCILVLWMLCVAPCVRGITYAESAPDLRQSCVHFGGEIEATAHKYRLDPTLLAAIAAQESGSPGEDSGNNIIGDHGYGYGLFQIDARPRSAHMDFTSSPNAMVPAYNADYAGLILRNFLRKYGDINDAVKAYNAGIPMCGDNKTSWPSIGQKLCYLDSVLKHQQDIVTHQQDPSYHC